MLMNEANLVRGLIFCHKDNHKRWSLSHILRISSISAPVNLNHSPCVLSLA